MKAMKRGTGRGVLLAVGVLLVLMIALFYLLFGAGRMRKWRDLHRFSEESYGGAFLGMYDISTYSEEDFTIYRGIPTVKAEYTLQTWRELSRYLTEIFSSENTVTNVYLGLDPEILWEASKNNEDNWAENLKRYLTPYIEARQDVAFEFLLPIPSLQYWVELEPAQMEEHLAVYGRLVEDMSAYSNTTVYFMGGEQWLISNPDNYQDELLPIPQVSSKIFLYTFCDHGFQIVPTNAGMMFERLTELVEQEKDAPTVYPDLSGWCMVFFGDSVLEYNAGSCSVSGVVEGLSGAQVYNCGQGGIAATENPDAALTFNRMVIHFLEQDISGLDGMNNYIQGLTEYMQEKHDGKRYCFVLNFGFNDYFSACPVDNPEDVYDVGTYAGALRTGIRILKEVYPEAEILLLTPTYTTFFSEGMDINGEGGGVLTDYVDAALRVAEEMDVWCINNYAYSGISAENQEQYLADGCHPNETGAFLLGNRILEGMEKVIAGEDLRMSGQF